MYAKAIAIACALAAVVIICVTVALKGRSNNFDRSAMLLAIALVFVGAFM